MIRKIVFFILILLSSIQIKVYANDEIINTHLNNNISNFIQDNYQQVILDIENHSKDIEEGYILELSNYAKQKEESLENSIDLSYHQYLTQAKKDIDTYAEVLKQYIDDKHNPYKGFLGWLYRMKINYDVNQIRNRLINELEESIE